MAARLTWEGSWKQRARVPAWYDDAKLGIMIHWGPYSVPAWAPSRVRCPASLPNRAGSTGFPTTPMPSGTPTACSSPEAPPTTTIAPSCRGSPATILLARTFRQGLKDWDPAPLIEPLAGSGARYVVLTAKHHDGFLLWNARRRHPRRRGWQVARDLVGEIARRRARARPALRAVLLRRPGLDLRRHSDQEPTRTWPLPCRARARTPRTSMHTGASSSPATQPSILWNDRGCPAEPGSAALFSAYYEAVPDGVVNDRFGQSDLGETGGLGRRVFQSNRPSLRRGGTIMSPARTSRERPQSGTC